MYDYMRCAIKKLTSSFNNIKFRTKLVCSHIFLIIIPMIIMGVVYYDTSSNIILSIVKENIYEMVKNNNQLIDAKLQKIEDSAQTIIIDKQLYDIINTINPAKKSNLVKADRELQPIIYKYFLDNPDIYSASFISSRYTLGGPNMFMPLDKIKMSKLYSYAMESEGQLKWIPTYDFIEMFSQYELENTNIDYRYLLSAVRILNCSYVENNVVVSMDSHIERPILVINMKEDIFKDIYNGTIAIEGAYHMIISKSGKIISHSDTSKLGKTYNYNWLNEANLTGSGITMDLNENGKVLVFFDTSSITDWIYAAIVPMDGILKKLDTIKYYTLYLAIVLICIAIGMACIISGQISKPIDKLVKAMQRIGGSGDLTYEIPIKGNNEISYMMQKFNEMNKNMDLLIQENYKSKIREKEMQIMALNLQLNPHFLYNTLNIINWMAIDSGQDAISKMIISLCTMLQYTLKNDKDILPFRDDLEWLKSYIHIMKMRFDQSILVEYHIDEEIYDCMVPKLFLQPFIENSIIHGFEGLDTTKKIKVSAYIKGSDCYFSVYDNGKGIKKEELEQIFEGDPNSIGIINVDKRIKLMYGNEYGVHIESTEMVGTEVCIRIPMQKQ